MKGLPVDSANSTLGEQGRRARRVLLLAFGAVVLGLLSIDVLLVATLRPTIAELTDIGERHGRMLSMAERLREGLGQALSRPASVEDVAGWEAVTSELETFADTPFEKAALARLREALSQCALASAGLDQHARVGDIGSFRAAVHDMSRATRLADHAAEQLVRFNATEMGTSTRDVRRAVLLVMLASTCAGLVSAGAALGLLRHALAGIDRHAEAMEEHAAEMSAFAGRAAHELRSPLQVLALTLESVREKGAATKALDRASAAVGRLRDTIDDLLEFSTAGAQSDAAACTEVRAVVEEVAEELEATTARRVAVQREVPPGIEAAIAPGHLRTVLSNLVGNAVKYAALAADARVEVSGARDGGCVELVVRDTGPGIPREALEHIFEPYFRASSAPGGHGLGLAIVRRIVEAHGGAVRVESAPGLGSTFVVRLPLAGPGDPASRRCRPGGGRVAGPSAASG